jgi:hypothetical protein
MLKIFSTVEVLERERRGRGPAGRGVLKDMQVFSIFTVDVKGKWRNHRWI